MADKLTNYLKSKIFTQLTQCPTCGQENGWSLDDYFDAYSGPCELVIFCKNCFAQVFFDGDRIRDAIQLSREDMNREYYQIYYTNPSPYEPQQPSNNLSSKQSSPV